MTGSGSGRGRWTAVGPVGDPGAWGRGQRRWMAGALFALVFAAPFFTAVLGSAHSNGWKSTAIGLLVAYCGLYVMGPARAFSATLLFRLLVLAALLALSLALFPFLGVDTCGLWTFLAVAAAMLLPARVTIGVAVVLAAATLILSEVAGQGMPWEQALILLSITGLMVGFAGNIRLTRELRDTREELAVAAVAAERARIGRDLHDILGHSLTAITVKAGLARRLTELDPAAAAVEIADVERLAREALADVRATASGFREVSLASELAVAAAVLRAAGIAAALPTAVDDVAPQARELFGYVVREAVTNVVRHSGATRVSISVTGRSIEIIDDGVPARPPPDDRAGPERPAPPGCGLAGLRDRVLAVGGRVEAGDQPGGGFRVAVTIPAVTSPAVTSPAVTRPPTRAPALTAPRKTAPTKTAAVAGKTAPPSCVPSSAVPTPGADPTFTRASETESLSSAPPVPHPAGLPPR